MQRPLKSRAYPSRPLPAHLLCCASLRPARQRPIRQLCLLLSLLALGACTVTEVRPEMGTAATGGETTGGGAATPEMAVRLPAIRLASRAATPIDTLTQEKADDKVAVSGTIVQRSAILDGWLYQIRDDSGSVWVLTDSSTPQLNESVLVEGVVRYEPIVVGEVDASGVYIEEQSYRAADE